MTLTKRYLMILTDILWYLTILTIILFTFSWKYIKNPTYDERQLQHDARSGNHEGARLPDSCVLCCGYPNISKLCDPQWLKNDGEELHLFKQAQTSVIIQQCKNCCWQSVYWRSSKDYRHCDINQYLEEMIQRPLPITDVTLHQVVGAIKVRHEYFILHRYKAL